MVSLQAIRQASEELFRPWVRRKGFGQVARDLNLSRCVVQGEGDVNRVARDETGGLADGRAHADE